MQAHNDRAAHQQVYDGSAVSSVVTIYRDQVCDPRALGLCSAVHKARYDDQKTAGATRALDRRADHMDHRTVEQTTWTTGSHPVRSISQIHYLVLNLDSINC